MRRSKAAVLVLVTAALTCSGSVTAALPSRVPPPAGVEANNLTVEVYRIGKQRDKSQINSVLAALKHRQQFVRLIAWLSVGRLEAPETLDAVTAATAKQGNGEHFYARVARARIAAAGEVPSVRTEADLQRKVRTFLAKAGTSTDDLRGLPGELAAARSVVDGLDTPPPGLLCVEALGEIVADAKRRGIDTRQIERSLPFSLSGRATLRLALAVLPTEQRITLLIDRLMAGRRDYDRSAAQALTNEGGTALPAIDSRLAAVMARPDQADPRALTGLIEVLWALGPAAVRTLERLVAHPDPGVRTRAEATIRSISNGHKRLLDADY